MTWSKKLSTIFYFRVINSELWKDAYWLAFRQSVDSRHYTYSIYLRGCTEQRRQFKYFMLFDPSLKQHLIWWNAILFPQYCPFKLNKWVSVSLIFLTNEIKYDYFICDKYFSFLSAPRTFPPTRVQIGIRGWAKPFWQKTGNMSSKTILLFFSRRKAIP